MDLTMFGQPTAPVVAVLSTFDPFHREHRSLVWALQSYARRRALSPVVILLDPAPAQLIQGDAKWAVYHDATARLRLLDSVGLDAIALVRFHPDDLKVAARAFFSLVCARMPLVEFWLRHGQSVGSGSGGNDLAVWIQGRVRGFRVRVLPREDRGRDNAAIARQFLKAGRVLDAERAIGVPPMMERPHASNRCRTAWMAGRYLATDALAAIGTAPRTFELDFLAQQDGTTAFAWPDPSVRSLRFLRGPVDDVVPAANGGAASSAPDATLRAPVTVPHLS